MQSLFWLGLPGALREKTGSHASKMNAGLQPFRRELLLPEPCAAPAADAPRESKSGAPNYRETCRKQTAERGRS